MAPAIIAAMGWDKNTLTEEQRQTVSTLSTLAAGLAGGVVGDSTSDAIAGAQTGQNAVSNNFLSVSDKTEFELAKQKLNSSDPAEREKAQQTINTLIEKDITSDQKVIDACSNGGAGSAACAQARLDVIAAKEGYDNLGNYNSKASQQYADAYGQIVNLLNITSVDAQNQQQVKDAMVNYAMLQLGVDKATAEQYVSTYDGMKIVAASMSPVLGYAAASKLSLLGKDAAIQNTVVNGKPITLDNGFYTVDGLKISQNYYDRLWSQGRPAPFLQAKEVLNSNPSIVPDPRGAPGYFKYEGAGLEMIYNPETGQIGHIQPIKGK